MNPKSYCQEHNIPTREFIAKVKEIAPKYSKETHCMASNPDYGVCLRPVVVRHIKGKSEHRVKSLQNPIPLHSGAKGAFNTGYGRDVLCDHARPYDIHRQCVFGQGRKRDRKEIGMNTYQAEDKLLELFDEVVFKSAMLGIYRLTKRAAALSGTEDSGNQKSDYTHDNTGKENCQ